MSSRPDTTLPNEMAPPEIATQRPRLLSLDALRGFDMLWIIGAAGIFHQLFVWLKTPWLGALDEQLKHVPWDGLHAYDLIFPLFMFLSGVAIPFSFESRLRQAGGKRALAGKIVSRTLILVVLGMIYNGLLSDQPAVPRLASVLGQIGIAWGIAATVYVLVPGTSRRFAIAAAIVGGITLLQLFVPVPGHGAGVLTQEGALNAWLDRALLPGRLHGKTFDPEGLLCVLSASSVTLAGAILGSSLQRASAFTWRMVGCQCFAGVALIAVAALAWKLGYPPIKALWTGTFDLFAIGISVLLFALFFAVIDVLRVQRWAFPLQVIGMNALTIYLLTRFFDFKPAAAFLFGRLAHSVGDAGPVVLAAGTLLIEWVLLWFLYRKKIFLRV